MSNDAAHISALSKWIDAHAPDTHGYPFVLTRVTKIGEEYGEVIEALHGLLGENPRKGRTHTLNDLQRELMDVALCALAAWEHIDGNHGDVMTALSKHIRANMVRAGIMRDE